MSHTKAPWKIKLSRNMCDEYDSRIEPIGLYLHDRIEYEDAHIIKAAASMYESLLALHAVGILNDGELGDDAEVLAAQKLARDAMSYAEDNCGE